jgi:hypothetical protein
MKSIFFASVLIVSFFGRTPAWAGPGVSSGGNDVGVLFRQAAQLVLDNVYREAILFPEIGQLDLYSILNSTTILVTTKHLTVDVNGVSQPSAAINYRSPNTIIVSGDLWFSMPSDEVRQALAFHEILCLAGLESTGKYNISSRYLGTSSLSGIYRDGCQRISYELVLEIIRIRALSIQRLDVSTELFDADGAMFVEIYYVDKTGKNYLFHFAVSPINATDTFDCLVSYPTEQDGKILVPNWDDS